MRYIIGVMMMLALVPVLAQPVPLSPYEEAMQAGDAANAQGQLLKALAAYRKAVAAAEAVPDHPEWLIQSLMKYGNLTMRAGDEGRDQLAAEIYARALQVTETTYGADDLRVLEPMMQMAWQYWRLKKYPEAEQWFFKAEAIAGKQETEAPARLADVRFALGGFYSSQKAWLQAIAYYQQALKTYEQTHGAEEQRTLRTQYNVASCLLQNQQYREAEAQLLPLVETLTRIKPNGWELAQALSALSAVYVAQQQYEKAEPLALQEFSIAEKSRGADNVGMLNNNERMAKFYRLAGKPEKAEPYLKQEIVIILKNNSAQHYLAETREEYADLLTTLHRPEEARQQLQAVYEHYEQLLARITGKHQDTGEVMVSKFYHEEVQKYIDFLDRYRRFLQAQDNKADAGKIVKRAVQVKELLKRSKEIYERK